jgi:hypothetical protein
VHVAFSTCRKTGVAPIGEFFELPQVASDCTP